MKTKYLLLKKASLLLAMLLSLSCLALPVSADELGTYVYDFADVMDDSEETGLNVEANLYSAMNGIGYYFVADSLGEDVDVNEYLSDFMSNAPLNDNLFLVFDTTDLSATLLTQGAVYDLIPEDVRREAVDTVSELMLSSCYEAGLSFLDAVKGYSLRDFGFEGLPEEDAADEVQRYPDYQPIVKEGSKQLVFDQAHLFSPDEAQALQDKAAAFAKKSGMDVVCVTTDDAGGRSATAYADDYYDYNGFKENGILFLIDMDNREVWISTKGTSIRLYTDDRIEDLLDAAFEYMPDGYYGDAMNAMLDRADELYEDGYVNGQYNYNTETGEISVRRSITWVEALIAVAVALLVGGLTALGICSSYKLKGGKLAYSGGRNELIRMDRNDDTLIDHFVTSRVIQTSSDSDRSSGGGGGGGGCSSTHTSSSGSTHGGGGRSF